ncbi:MAG: methyltransferase domain-containing protein [Gemmatimonadetes bacterium]|nr:methyltransferase domain-containing protein [Gemmatimonadota bacterium]
MTDVATPERLEQVQAYYGARLRSSADLRTDACTTAESPAPRLAAALARVHPEVLERYYGCGLVAPEAIEGATILDLGSGAGRDAYTLAQLVGEGGRVIGVDATREQLAVARRHLEWHRERFGYARGNVAFVEHDLDHLATLPLEADSVDVAVSNCVFNLLRDKGAAFRQVHRLLRAGGEFYFSDVYADRRLPHALLEDPELVGECLAGALYWNDFLALARAAGFGDPRLVTSRRLGIRDDRIAGRLAPARFYAATWRLFKLEGLEPACEDYGQAVRYHGGIPGAEALVHLDGHHPFEAGKIVPVCGNSWRMLAETRLARWFSCFGDTTRHYGIFAGCGTSLPFAEAGGEAPAAGACC